MSETSDMSDIKPLLDSDMPDELARVLRSARADGPPANEPVEARTLAAVAAHHAATSNPGKRRVGSGMLAKTMLALLVASAATATVVARMTAGSGSLGAKAPATAIATTTAMPAESLYAPTPPLPPSPSSFSLTSPPSLGGVSVDDLPSAPAEATPVKSPSSRSARTAAPDFDIEDELGLIDAARAALAAKRSEEALKQVQTYARRFRGGHFTEEAQALEVQALAAMGRGDEATAKGQRFFAAHPGSAYERRVRSALAPFASPESQAGKVTP